MLFGRFERSKYRIVAAVYDYTMLLPLLERAKEKNAYFLVTPKTGARSGVVPQCGTASAPGAASVPQRAPQPGEQYRFHFDMTKCIGCKCCVVACNEQNGNPADINWRRVGEIEGGWYPNTHRSYLSMGCNHCMEPTCLKGCPVDAYSKDPVTGVVLYSAEACIGCQYCTWNCSYGVPQYNPERGVVGKCDMCHERLDEGRAPACVSACPEAAIRIEIVNIAEWKREYAANANAPGLPSADDSISSTRITLPDNLPPDTRKADFFRVKPEDPHWPLAAMTVLTQQSVGAFVTIWLLQLFGKTTRLGIAALVSLVVAGLALSASTLHLGRPIYAYRALKTWKRSWLSREVLLFGCFSGVAFLYAALLWFKLPGSLAIGALTSPQGATLKTEGSSEPVPLTGLAHDVLLSWKKEQADKAPFLFPSPVKPGQPITTVKTAWKTTLKNAGVAHFPIYHLRHVFCTRLSWVAPDAVVQRAMRHSSPETKRHYQLGMVEQVRQNLEKANEKVYGKGKVLRFYDGQPAAGNEQEMTACK